MSTVGLGHLVERLDEEAEWSTALAAGEQHRVGFARALIHKPAVLLIDDADAMLDRVVASGHPEARLIVD